jgi:threonine/homoserine efflux transporter RhtA
MQMEIRPLLHIALHILAPLAVAVFCYRRRWLRAWLIMLAGWLIDVDHLLADPVYDPNRCSVTAHILHRWPAQIFYLLLAIMPRTRLAGLGLVIHVLLDALDCLAIASSEGA